jgi:hypothetical protein
LEDAWHELQDAYLGAREDVHNMAVVRLYAFPPGPVPDPPPCPPAAGGSPADEDLAAPASPDLLSWLERSPDPQPSLGQLWHAERSLLTHAPGRLDAELRRLADDLDAQMASGGPDQDGEDPTRPTGPPAPWSP